MGFLIYFLGCFIHQSYNRYQLLRLTAGFFNRRLSKARRFRQFLPSIIFFLHLFVDKCPSLKFFQAPRELRRTHLQYKTLIRFAAAVSAA